LAISAALPLEAGRSVSRSRLGPVIHLRSKF